MDREARLEPQAGCGPFCDIVHLCGRMWGTAARQEEMLKPVALITGAAGDIGRASAELFIEHGWQVYGVDAQPGDDMPKRLNFRQLDVSSPTEVDEMIEWLERDSGRLDSLVNNAAVQTAGSLTDLPVEDWDRTVDTTLRSAYLIIRRAHDLLAASEGSIVNVASVSALATSPGSAAFAASRGGLMALTRSMAVELGADGIRVNAVLPGAVDTEMKLAKLGKRTAVGRVASPAEAARAILFLSDNQQSSYISGHGLVVDGGAMARLSTE